MTYEVSVLHRGETVRYAEGPRWLEAVMTSSGGHRLYTWSARWWQSPKGVPLSEGEFKVVIERIVEFLRTQGVGVTVDNSCPETAEERVARLESLGVDVAVKEGKVVYRRSQFATADDVKKAPQ